MTLIRRRRKESVHLPLTNGCLPNGEMMSPYGPSVWTGRALQAESDDLERLVLRFCIRPIDGAFELLAIMDYPRAFDLIRVSAPKARRAT